MIDKFGCDSRRAIPQFDKFNGGSSVDLVLNKPWSPGAKREGTPRKAVEKYTVWLRITRIVTNLGNTIICTVTL